MFILMKKMIILRKMLVKMKSFAPSFPHHRKKLNIFTPQMLIYYIQYWNRKSRLVQMLEAATGGVLQNFAKLTGNTCARGNTCELCKIFKNTFFTEQLWTTASEMRTL